MKSEKLEIRLTVAEKERLYAMSDGARLSDYVKGVLFGGVIPDRQVVEASPEPVPAAPAGVHERHVKFPYMYNQNGHKWGCSCDACGVLVKAGVIKKARMKYASVSKSEG